MKTGMFIGTMQIDNLMEAVTEDEASTIFSHFCKKFGWQGVVWNNYDIDTQAHAMLVNDFEFDDDLHGWLTDEAAERIPFKTMVRIRDLVRNSPHWEALSSASDGYDSLEWAVQEAINKLPEGVVLTERNT